MLFAALLYSYVQEPQKFAAEFWKICKKFQIANFASQILREIKKLVKNCEKSDNLHKFAGKNLRSKKLAIHLSIFWMFY